MKIKDIYNLAVEKGIEKDPRGREKVESILARTKKRYNKLREDDQKYYDQERFHNPYSDTRILVGDPEKQVKHLLAGIDMEIGEVLLADRLREKGEGIDLIIAHHPEGKALAALHDVMHLQEDVLAHFGVPINVAEDIMSSRISEVKRGLMPANHNRAVDAAKILDLPFMCVHTPADNHVTSYLQEMFDEKKPEALEDVIDLLLELPEYQEAAQVNAGPFIVVGNKERTAGKIFVDMTGGTGGSKDAYEKLSQAGVGTLVVMHIGEAHRKEAKKHHINVINAGHMASDSLGMNLFLDRLEKEGIKIQACSGLIRYSRV